MYERFTDRSRKVMQLANQEAMRANCPYIDTPHILLGLCKEGSGVAANVLKNLDVDLGKIRTELERLLPPFTEAVSIGKLPQTPEARLVIENAINEARKLNHNYVGTEHLLLGILADGKSVACAILASMNLTPERVRDEALALLGPSKPEPEEDDRPSVIRMVHMSLAFASEAGGFKQAKRMLDIAEKLSEAVANLDADPQTP